MTVYPAWWDKTITVYNRYETAVGEVTWYRTAIVNAFVKNTGEQIIIGDTAIDTAKVKCRIPKDERFLPKYEWDALASKDGKFTLAPGDIIVFGAVTDTVDEYTTGKHSTDLLEKYKTMGDMVIESVNINVGAGLGMEHYHVKGV